MRARDGHRFSCASRVLSNTEVSRSLLRSMAVVTLASVGILFPACKEDILVVEAPLICSAAPGLADGPLPFEVCFIEAVVGGMPPYDYSWDFGDGGSSTQQDPCYTYQAIGRYTATLTVSDAAGDDCQVTNLFVEAGVLKCSLEVTASSGPVPLGVIWTGTALQGTPPYNMTLDGNFTNIGNTMMLATIITVPGQYSMTFAVEDSDGATCEDTAIVTAQ